MLAFLFAAFLFVKGAVAVQCLSPLLAVTNDEGHTISSSLWGYSCNGTDAGSVCHCNQGKHNSGVGSVTCDGKFGQWLPFPQPCTPRCVVESQGLTLHCKRRGIPLTPSACDFPGPVCVPEGTVCEVQCASFGAAESESSESSESTEWWAACELSFDAGHNDLVVAWNMSLVSALDTCRDSGGGGPEEETCGVFVGISPEHGSMLSWLEVTVSVAAIVATGIILELLHHFAHHKFHRHRRAMLYIENLHHEFMVAGVLSFGLFMAFTSCALADEELLQEAIESLHQIIFLYILFFFACTLWTLLVSSRLGLEAKLKAATARRTQPPAGDPKPSFTYMRRIHAAEYRALHASCSRMSPLMVCSPTDVDRYIKICIQSVGQRLLQRTGWAFILASPVLVVLLRQGLQSTASTILYFSPVFLGLTARVLSNWVCSRRKVHVHQLREPLAPANALTPDAVKAYCAASTSSASRDGTLRALVWGFALYSFGVSAFSITYTTSVGRGSWDPLSIVSIVVDFLVSTLLAFDAIVRLEVYRMQQGLPNQTAMLDTLAHCGHLKAADDTHH